MHTPRLCRLLGLLVLIVASFAAGCPRREEGLIVNVQTDYIPVAEFDTVRVRLDDADVRDVAMAPGVRVSRPMFMTTYDMAAPGTRVVSVSLMRGSLELARRNVQVQFGGTYLVTVVLTRSCAGLSCIAGQSCLGRRCVPDTCITGLEPSCPMPECTSNAACASTTPCVEGECLAGACFQRPNDALCTTSEVCLPETGCIPRPVLADAGIAEDANADASAGDSGMCRGPADCADAFTCTVDSCTGGVCGHDPDNALCPMSACAPMDPSADPTTGCLPACDATTCVAAPCETATCVAGRCERTPLCASGESCCAGSCALDCGAVPCAGQPAGTMCRASAGPCDVAETCDGTNPECPPDALAPATTTCRAAVGPCDVAERCTTGTVECATDAFVATGVACPAGSCDGLGACSSACVPGAACSTGNPCEVGEFACGPTRCVATGPAPAATICRAPAGPCDRQETCGGATTCPPDGFASTGICRDARGACDVAETCNGSSANCPADTRRPTTYVCRGAAGTCDVEERCGGGDDCPANGFQTGGVCRAGGECDPAEMCTGASANCPTDVFSSSSTVCRAAGGVCDQAETCTGTARGCPADVFRTGVCRASAGPCDAVESCSGSSATCPGDTFQSGTTCRISAGPCDNAETCTGTTAACPADGFRTGVCRAATLPCDVAESCTGSSAACPGDGFVAGGTACRGSAGPCDVVESCTGSSAACPGDGFIGVGTICRGSAGVCDVAESCNGASAACPGDGFLPTTTVCRGNAGLCDSTETCTGSSAACPPDARRTGQICGISTGPCNIAAVCGLGVNCPANTTAPDGSSCDERCGNEQCSGGNCVGGFECGGMGCNCDSVCYPSACP